LGVPAIRAAQDQAPARKPGFLWRPIATQAALHEGRSYRQLERLVSELESAGWLAMSAQNQAWTGIVACLNMTLGENSKRVFTEGNGIPDSRSSSKRTCQRSPRHSEAGEDGSTRAFRSSVLTRPRPGPDSVAWHRHTTPD